MKNKKYLAASALFAAIAMVAVASPTFAQTAPAAGTPTVGTAQGAWGGKMGGMRGGMGMHRGVYGSVTAINGNSLTVTSTNPKTQAVTTYTVDATNAKVMKAGAVSSVSAIAVGDTVMVAGPLTGTSVAATNIMDGKMMPRAGMMQGKPAGALAQITGDGQPVIMGTIASVNGSTITITNKSNVTYTVDATNAKFTKMGTTTATISNVATGDNVLVQGAVSGTSITATSVIDQGVAPAQATTNTSGQPVPPKNAGFFGKIARFFSHLF